MRRHETPTCYCGRIASMRLDDSLLCSSCSAGEYDAIPLRTRRDFSRLGVRAGHVRASVREALDRRRDRLNAKMPSKDGERWAREIAAIMVRGDES